MGAARLPPSSLAGFPAFHLLPSQRLYRIHRVGRGPWWFSSDLPLRFDLVRPNGTCYLAEDDLGAFIQVFQEFARFVASEALNRRALSTLIVPAPVTLADCTESQARGFGVTAEIHSSVDRAWTRAWVAAFARDGYGGVRLFVRNDPAQRRVGIALIGAAGEAPWPIESTRPIDSDLARRAEQEFGLQVR